MRRISLRQAVDFHGHLGPYLVLGLLMGRFALNKIKARPHFGLKIRVWGADKKPKSCLIDGLQLSTGCTYGKGNIVKYNGKVIRANFINCENRKSINLVLREEISENLSKTMSHKQSEKFASQLYRSRPENIFEIVGAHS